MPSSQAMPRALLSARHPHPGILKIYHTLRLRRTTTQYDSNNCLGSRSRTFSLVSGPSTSLWRRARSDVDEVSLSAPAFEAPDKEDLTFTEALKMGALEMLYKHRKRQKPQDIYVKYPALGDSLYGKWQFLSLDEDTMRRESDIKASDGANLRLIDQPGNENDIQLWGCLLEFCHRRMGYEGVAMLWQSVLKKKTLHQVDGPLAQAFWGRILSAAVTNDAFLREVVDYAKWLYEEHNVQWPKLYTTVMRYMLPNGGADQVLQWHVTLASLYPVNEVDFAAVIKEHITIPNDKIQKSLRLLYKTGRHHTMYDLMIPYLYSQGHEFLARHWRRIFLLVNDGPKSSAARPFIRYLIAYYSGNTKFTNEEMAIANPAPKPSAGATDGFGSGSSKAAITGHNLSYLVNRVHGETFGINEKPYNDQLGAKWLASTWVSLDFAISVLYTMGVQEIGPLSLRAIAWRERLAQPLLSRFNQLTQLKIGITESSYARALRHHATVGDDEALKELVRSDIHPDIFDNKEAQHEVLADCLRVGEWTTYRLILKTMMAVSSDYMSIKSNQVLQSCLRQGNATMALRIMRELRAQKIGLTSAASHAVSSYVAQNLSPHRGTPGGRQQVDLYRSLCHELAYTRFPPAVQSWRALLFRLGREGRLDDLERVSLQVLGMFTSHRKSDRPMWACHKLDVPDILRIESPYEEFQELPRDLGLRRENHPLRLIFDGGMQNAIVRWGFHYTRYGAHGDATATAILNDTTAYHQTHDAPPSHYYFARGIRLLAMLRDQGLFYFERTIRKQVTLRLAELYRGGGRADYEWVGGNRRKTDRRRRNRLTLAEAKQLCDKAWGREGGVTPGLLELEATLWAVEAEDEVRAADKAGTELV